MRNRTARTATALAAGLALLAGACRTGGDQAGPPRREIDLGVLKNVAALTSFDSCDGLLAELKRTAEAKVGPYGFGGGPVMYAEGAADARGPATTVVAPSATGTADDSAKAANDHSGTNNQEVGVDEADTVKTDGSRMVVLRGDTLTVIDVSNPSAPVRRSRLDLLPGDTGGVADQGGLVLDGDRVLALVGHWEQTADGKTGGAVPGGVVRGDIAPGPGGGATVTDVVSVSIADPAAPKVTDRATFDGSVVAARLVGDRARIVLSSTPLGFSWVYPQSDAGKDAATEANKAIIERSTLDDWLPRVRQGGSARRAVDCADVFTPPEFAGLGMVSVQTVPVADRIDPQGVGLLAQSETVYASKGHLYVTASAWVDPADHQTPGAWERIERSYRTDIHDFDISGDKAGYLASGRVRGHPLNQYALSEQDGRLRIATTDGPPWSPPQPVAGKGEATSESFVTIFEQKGIRLDPVGQVGGMGKGEMIRSVRFIGDTGYVVTFRQTDPFYVLDLSQPSAPRVVGELKIPGYSGYLHPVAEGRVLGVGADAGDDGRITGAKVSLFDVSDPAAPRELSSWHMAGGRTDVEFDPKAFLYWAETGLAVVPVDGWGGGGPVPMAEDDTAGTGRVLPPTGAVGLKVTDDAITEVGVVSHDRTGEKGRTECRRVSAEEIAAAGFGGYLGRETVAIDCGPDQPLTVTGYSCSEYSQQTLDQVTPAGGSIDLPEGHRIGVCYPQPVTQVQRAVVVGDRLLTLSDHDLRTSDLTTLAPGPFVDL